ncbi:acyltransferase [Altererythrobacter lauratis]|uniref:Acyltransferase family protein n=1 Tax=Alteraurantiacibacter lauratis TaxID=2054627 RepID=A0ABV7EBS5_9SPHN
MQERLYGLDALRGLAAFVVVLLHLGFPIGGAHLAVDFFFMLSGFVMARTYEARLTSGALSPWRFVVARYRRLWGWMALGTSIGLVAALARGDFSGDLLLAWGLMLAMLPALNMAATTPYLLNQPLWSIFYELLANVAHAFGLARMGRKGLLALALVCAVGLAWAIERHGFPRGGFPMYHWLVLWRVGLAYVLGVLIFRLWGDVPPIRVSPLLALAVLPAYVLATYFWPVAWGPLLFILVLAPLMMFGGMAARPEGWRRNLAAWLGALSFPLYALHYPAIALLQTPGGAAGLLLVICALWLWHRRRKAAQPAGREMAPKPADASA